MFLRIAQNTYRGLLQWPDLLALSVPAIAVLLLIDRLFGVLWDGVAAGSSTALVIVLLLGIINQFVQMAVASVFIVAMTRIIFARMAGGEMSLREGIQVQPYLKHIMTYTAVYVLVSMGLSLAYLFITFGPDGVRYLVYATSGVSGLMQVPTAEVGAAACLIILVFLPVMLVWALANILTAQIIVAENIGGFEVVSRGRKLVMRTISVFVFMFMTIFAAVLFYTVLASILGLVDTSAPLPATASFPEPSAQMQIFFFVLNVLIHMIGTIFNAYWYAEARNAVNEDAQGIEPV